MNMKLNLKLEIPRAVLEARAAKKGRNWFVELLIFTVLFFVISLAQSFAVVPVQIFLMSTDRGYLDAVAAGDYNLLMDAAARLASSDPIIISMLFSNIFMILITMLFCKLLQKRRMETLGFVKKDFLKEYGIGLVVGFAIFSAAVLLCVVTGSLKLTGFSASFTPGIFLLFGLGFLIQGMAEEVLLRSYLFVSIGRRYPMWVAVILNALFFAALHLANSGISVLAFLNLTLFGVFASVYFIKRGSIWGIGALHSIWNFVQGNFYGIKVSGIETSCTVFGSVTTEGRGLIHGGAFGMEGGLATTVVLVAGTLFLLTRKAKDGVFEAAEAGEAQPEK